MMSEKERRRKIFLSNIEEKKLSLKEGACQMGLSYRQAQRLWKRYREQGDEGVVHRSRGKVSNRGYGRDYKEAVVKRYQACYEGFGPTFALEKLEKEGYVCCVETLRLWLKEAGL